MNQDTVTLAPIKLRLYSFLIDLVILVPYTFLSGILLRECLNLSGNEFSQFLVYVCLNPFYIAAIFVIIIFPEGIWGQTLGKWAVGIKVVDQSDQRPGILGSVIRHVLNPLDLFLLVGYFIAHKNINYQRIGDMVAHTIVVRKINGK
jgi:uncharacterized RDD family membrane protein YckC